MNATLPATRPTVFVIVTFRLSASTHSAACGAKSTIAPGDRSDEHFLCRAGDHASGHIANGSADHRPMAGQAQRFLSVQVPFVEADGAVEPDGMVQAEGRK